MENHMINLAFKLEFILLELLSACVCVFWCILRASCHIGNIKLYMFLLPRSNQQELLSDKQVTLRNLCN